MKASASSTSRTSDLSATRRKSLKSLLHIPLLPRNDDIAQQRITSNARSTRGTSVPADIILSIADWLAPCDVLNLSLTSRAVRSLLIPALYATVVLKSSRQCRVALTALLEQPAVCATVRKLAVRPNYYLAWPKPDEHLDEQWVVDAIIRIAPKLTGLHTFDWDGLEMPEDYLWPALRQFCPQLRTVYSNVGSKPLDPESQLFNFTNLTSFSLIVRHGLGGSDLFPTAEELPERLWDMLLNKCPDLEEISICSFSSSARLFSFDQITSARWPKLHTLTLGSFGYTSDFLISQPSDDALSGFLAAHQALKHVRLSWNFKRWISPETIPLSLPETALPELKTYIGIYQQLAQLPNPAAIETLDLTCEPIYEMRVADICPVLRSLTALTSLDVWVYIPSPGNDYYSFFQLIIGSCPTLKELHFMCTTSFTSKPLKQLSSLLRLLPDLKTFTLTKGHKYRDESMLQSALRIIKDNPGLTQVNIRSAREKCPNHLKQEGAYEVKSNADGVPSVLVAHERGLTVVGRSFERQYEVELNPRGKFGALKQQTAVQRPSARI
ncbi:hypothetical protein HGRIS_014025 [Hohenbuehelia grisea]|uniref:F-box domain-containing protein n=1 Tax=Hohenbuehelia grisea TaxID=104357 RepID=A0ABR3JU58_9AGAR